MSATALRSETMARDVANIAVFAGLIVALTVAPAVNLGFTPVPITLQTLAVTLTAAILGPRRGALAVAVYCALIAVGLPVGANHKGGISVFTGPTGGFLIGFIAAAFVIGVVVRLLTRRTEAGMLWKVFVASVVSLPVTYAFGLVWFQHVTGMAWAKAFKAACYTFIPGDLIKAAVAAVIVAAVARALPGLVSGRR